MSVQLGWTTVMKMPPAITPLVALSVPAMLVLREMESTVQVRLAISHGCIAVWIICLQNNYDVYINFMLELLSPVKPTITSFHRHQ